MTYQFRREYLCEWVEDPEHELYVQAWEAYHVAADRIDGHLPRGDRRLAGAAVLAGTHAMNRVLYEAHMVKPSHSDKKWQAAKREALRRLESFR